MQIKFIEIRKHNFSWSCSSKIVYDKRCVKHNWTQHESYNSSDSHVNDFKVDMFLEEKLQPLLAEYVYLAPFEPRNICPEHNKNFAQPDRPVD
jgi:hypothetical protein